MGNTQTLERVLTVGENIPVMFTRGDDQYTGWELHLKAPDNHKAQIGPPDSRGWSLDVDENRQIATVGCGIREHANVIWLNSPDGEYPFHTRIEGVITGCQTAGTGSGGEPPPFSIEIIDGLVFLIEEESNTGVDTPIRIAAYRRQGSEYWSGEGETDWIPVEVDWSCVDTDLVFLESVMENDEHSPGEPLTSDDMRQTSVWVKSSQEDSYTVTANFEGTDSGSGNLPAQQLTAYVNVYDLALVVDANRDLKINHLDRKNPDGTDVITSENPWRFWYNDDDDFAGPSATSEFNVPTHSEEESDIAKYMNDGDEINPAIRDFTDMYPLYMYVKSHYLKTKKTNGDMVYDYVLSISELDTGLSDLNISSIFTKLEAGESGKYLSDVVTAEEISKIVINDAYRSRAKGSIVFTQGTRSNTIVGGFLNNILNGKGGVLLRQHFGPGVIRGKFELKVTQSDGTKVFSKELPFSFSNVENMFSHIDLTNYAKNDESYENQSRYDTTSPSNYPDTLTNDKRFVYVHGYNNNMTASRGSNAEIFKRLYLLGSNAKYIAVSWYGWMSQVEFPVVGYKAPEYQQNVIHAFQTAPALKSRLGIPTLSKPKTIIMAHSLGNMLVSSAIEDHNMNNAEKYYSLNAAVSQEAYIEDPHHTIDPDMIHKDWLIFYEAPDAWNYDKLYAFNWHTLFDGGDVADSRRTLTWSGRFKNVPARTKIINLWSKGDKAFMLHPKESDPRNSLLTGLNVFYFGTSAFPLQEKLKGRGPLYLNITVGNIVNENIKFALGNEEVGGWGFNPEWNILENRLDAGTIPAEDLKTKP